MDPDKLIPGKLYRIDLNSLLGMLSPQQAEKMRQGRDWDKLHDKIIMFYENEYDAAFDIAEYRFLLGEEVVPFTKGNVVKYVIETTPEDDGS